MKSTFGSTRLNELIMNQGSCLVWGVARSVTGLCGGQSEVWPGLWPVSVEASVRGGQCGKGGDSRLQHIEWKCQLSLWDLCVSPNGLSVDLILLDFSSSGGSSSTLSCHHHYRLCGPRSFCVMVMDWAVLPTVSSREIFSFLLEKSAVE